MLHALAKGRQEAGLNIGGLFQGYVSTTQLSGTSSNPATETSNIVAESRAASARLADLQQAIQTSPHLR